MDDQKILDFYSDKNKNSEYEKLMRSSFDVWERRHNFIQWIFPSDEPSRAQPDSPVLSKDFDYSKLDETRVMKSFANFILFLQYCVRNGIIESGEPNHNYLRITRSLKFAKKYFGTGSYYKKIREKIMSTLEDIDIPDNVTNFWKKENI